jgi:hypothetical protein
MNTLNIVSALGNPTTMSGSLSIEEYTNIWLNAFPLAQTTGKKYWKRRLQELQTWDTCNNKPNERQGKINALKQLINQ